MGRKKINPFAYNKHLIILIIKQKKKPYFSKKHSARPVKCSIPKTFRHRVINVVFYSTALRKIKININTYTPKPTVLNVYNAGIRKYLLHRPVNLSGRRIFVNYVLTRAVH